MNLISWSLASRQVLPREGSGSLSPLVMPSYLLSWNSSQRRV